ncbi:inositol monophosphatase family protein [uncultured Devosia sp.]|uniref:inositol monophosphatase family protein n=1 Tax=uncultured Devosia sp. TaxID=211434 RepID=UPI0035CC9A97
MSVDRRLLLAETIMTGAGAIARLAFDNAALEVISKGPGDVVSETDFAIERMAREAIGAEFPDDGFIGEELGGGLLTTGYTWLIDPVDGTVNFTRKLGYFCVALALLENGRPIAAWTLDPLLNELFHAGPDHIARLNGMPIRCASQSDFGEAVIGLGFSIRHDAALNGAIADGLIRSGAEYRRLGAGALCLAHVAAGRLDAYFEPHMNPWDAMGGLYLAACAGAVTADYIGAGGLEHGAVVYAAAPAISSQLLAAVPGLLSGTPLHRENDRRSAGNIASDRKPSPNVETKQ